MQIVKNTDEVVNNTDEDTRDVFESTFTQLKEILQEYEYELLVRHDRSNLYSVYTPPVENNGGQFLFGRVEIHDFCVRYELEALDIYPGLFMTISPDLRKRMHGTSSFIFTSVDSGDVEKVKRLTQDCFEQLGKSGFIEKKVA